MQCPPPWTTLHRSQPARSPLINRGKLFKQTEPLLNIHSFNRYAYANNNPYRYKDTDGRVAETIFDLVSFGISVTIFKQDPTLANFLGAAVDGVALAIPFVPGGVGVYRAASKVAEDAAQATERAASKYIDITVPGSVANRSTGVSREAFERNLMQDGWERSISKDGNVAILTKDDARYVLRDNAKSTGGPTADFYKSGSKEPDLKIRLD
jgi:hypothetical protein